jgi:hypothetical protein
VLCPRPLIPSILSPGTLPARAMPTTQNDRVLLTPEADRRGSAVRHSKKVEVGC